MTVADTRAVVLDTHVLVWLLQGSERVGPRSRELVAAAVQADSVYVAAISTWEVAMLVANGQRTPQNRLSQDNKSRASR